MAIKSCVSRRRWTVKSSLHLPVQEPGATNMPYNKRQREELLLAHNAQLSCETPSLRILLVTKIDIVLKKVDWW